MKLTRLWRRVSDAFWAKSGYGLQCLQVKPGRSAYVIVRWQVTFIERNTKMQAAENIGRVAKPVLEIVGRLMKALLGV